MGLELGILGRREGEGRVMELVHLVGDWGLIGWIAEVSYTITTQPTKPKKASQGAATSTTHKPARQSMTI